MEKKETATRRLVAEVVETPKLPAYRERPQEACYADRESSTDEDWDNAAEEAQLQR